MVDGTGGRGRSGTSSPASLVTTAWQVLSRLSLSSLPHRNQTAHVLTHLDKAPFAVRPCMASDVLQLLALQAACACRLQTQLLDAAAIEECIAAPPPLHLTWVAEVSLERFWDCRSRILNDFDWGARRPRNSPFGRSAALPETSHGPQAWAPSRSASASATYRWANREHIALRR